jgi:glycosyltransferase involved in cell wall biosynthesis
MELSFSFIIPVYNRPEEIEELLHSFEEQTYKKPFEIVIVEDGSTRPSEEIIYAFNDALSISYFKKANSGPGASRNYGMQRATGNYFIVLDSDCLLPPQYLATVAKSLQENFVHCYGGPDGAHSSFSLVQKAINYGMTSVLTTGGIRGGKKAVGKFQPRSFNMGISKTAFEDVGGYGSIHPGEDPDLTFRLWQKGYETKLISDAFVYHKRRIDWAKFYKQVKNFGMVRPILNQWYPKTSKPTYWFPTLFCLGLVTAIILFVIGINLPLWLFGCYFVLIFCDSLLKNRSLAVALLSLVSVCIQFFGYGYGFLISTIKLALSRKEPQDIFPNLFFKTNL